MPKKVEKESKIRKRINKIYEENELANLESSRTRARSFTIGTAFGGIVEVAMRGDYSNLYCLLQPVEAVEFIEQLAAAAGLQVALRPRQDFASWRGWNTDADDRYWAGAAKWQLQGQPINQLEGSEEKEQLPENSLNNEETQESNTEENELEN